MDWQYFWQLFKGVVCNINNWMLSVPAWISGALGAAFWLLPKMEGGKMKTLLEKVRQHPAFICLSFLMLSVVLVSHSLYVNKSPHLATPNELISTVLQNKVIRTADLAMQDFVVRSRTFEDCQIYGPAVIYGRRCNFYGGHADGDSESSFIETSNRTVNGVILFEDCVFRDCRFHKIGFIGTPDQVARWKSQIAFSPSPPAQK